jgi:hypothetical protein
MRLLLDESVPKRLRRSLADHSVRTVVEAGWSGVKNGKLLALAAAEFDAFITVDKNLPFQQNLAAPTDRVSRLGFSVERTAGVAAFGTRPTTRTVIAETQNVRLSQGGLTVRAIAGRVFVEPRRGSMIGINCLRFTLAQPRVAQPHR